MLDYDFVKADLHIHTPASNCYKGAKNDDSEYIRILMKAKQEDLKIIAITDHNTILGYQKLMILKESLLNEKNALSRINDSKQAIQRLNEISSILSLYESILIIPGVEFEVNNCVHILVLFNPNVPVESIEAFLNDGGFKNEGRGDEDAFSTWDIIKFFEECMKLDCVCIDAHTDSVKGMYKTLASKLRAAAFKNDKLVAISYKDEKTKKEIEQIFLNPIYKRSTSLSFVRFSDAHIIEDIGKFYTFVKVEELNYASLIIALHNPIEAVATVKPEIKEILNKLISDDKSIFVKGIEDINAIAQAVVALANTSGGYCLVGIDENKVRQGVQLNLTKDGDNESILQKIKTLFNTSGEFRISLNEYELQGKKFILSIHVTESSGIVYMKNDNLVYIQNKNTYAIAPIEDIEIRIENLLMSKIEGTILKKVEAIEQNLYFVKNSIDTNRIIRNLRRKLTRIENYFSLEILRDDQVSGDITNKVSEVKSKSYNGITNGNVISLDLYLTPRLAYAYLRVTPPSYVNLNGVSINAPENSIIITQPGCVFLVQRDSYVYHELKLPVYLLQLRDEFSNNELLIRFYAMFLKSSFLFWFLQSLYESIDLYNPSIFRDIRIPKINAKHQHTQTALLKIKELSDFIIDAEISFTNEFDVLSSTNNSDVSMRDSLISNHNKLMDSLFYQIDVQIYDVLGLNDSDISLIEQSLKRLNIYIPEKIECFR